MLRRLISTYRKYPIRDIWNRLLEILQVFFFSSRRISSIRYLEESTNKHYLSLVIIVKNEATYLLEWIEYHKLIGVEHFYIYDNESTDNTFNLLKPYIDRKEVSYIHCPGQAMQMPAYNDAIARFGHNNFWMGFIDADEFIVLANNIKITHFLQNYENFSAIGINWKLFDSNGFDQEPLNGYVISNYTRTYKDDNTPVNRNFKSIVQPNKVKLCLNPHFMWLKKGYIVNEDKEAITVPIAEQNRTNQIQINHYFSKSKQEYLKKIARGCADTHPQRLENKSDYLYIKVDSIRLDKYATALKNIIPETYGPSKDNIHCSSNV